LRKKDEEFEKFLEDLKVESLNKADLLQENIDQLLKAN
jgi:hypothetical protein